jgi:peptide-methionine (S)-S-oxide reductase
MAEESREHYQHALQQVSTAPVTTEIIAAPVFYFAEAYHQQYLAKNPAGYCGFGGTGVCYPS